jgi:hypothetical protein
VRHLLLIAEFVFFSFFLPFETFLLGESLELGREEARLGEVYFVSKSERELRVSRRIRKPCAHNRANKM